MRLTALLVIRSSAKLALGSDVVLVCTETVFNVGNLQRIAPSSSPMSIKSMSANSGSSSFVGCEPIWRINHNYLISK